MNTDHGARDETETFEEALDHKRQMIAEALANPSEDNTYVASDDPSEMVRLRFAKEYVRITEQLMSPDRK